MLGPIHVPLVVPLMGAEIGMPDAEVVGVVEVVTEGVAGRRVEVTVASEMIVDVVGMGAPEGFAAARGTPAAAHWVRAKPSAPVSVRSRKYFVVPYSPASSA